MATKSQIKRPNFGLVTNDCQGNELWLQDVFIYKDEYHQLLSTRKDKETDTIYLVTTERKEISINESHLLTLVWERAKVEQARQILKEREENDRESDDGVHSGGATDDSEHAVSC